MQRANSSKTFSVYTSQGGGGIMSYYIIAYSAFLSKKKAVSIRSIKPRIGVVWHNRATLVVKMLAI